MITTMHTQCRLERAGVSQVSFIPAAFAQAGRWLKLKSAGVWQDGWRVAEVWGSSPTEAVARAERNFKTHRKATDV